MTISRKAYWLYKALLIFTFLVVNSTAISQEIEQEPNDPCSAAQILGEVVLPYYIDGSVDYDDAYDFFRFTAEPDAYLVANLDGILGVDEPLPYPEVLLYDSSCNFIYIPPVGSVLMFKVPADGEFILRASDGLYSSGSYRLSLDVASPPSSISGRIVDAETGIALPGDIDPYSQVILYKCDTLDCISSWEINQQYTDSEGRFIFDNSWYSSDLTAGTYQVEGRANGYIPDRTDPLTLAEGEQLDIGDLALSLPTYADSVTGRLVDAVTGLPLRGDAWPHAGVDLYYCYDGSACSWTYWINSATTDSDGVFIFSTDYMMNPLVTGWYLVYGFAWDYESADSGIFELIENEQKDLGDIELMPPPVSFSDVMPCSDLPPEGGKCRYNVRITNNLPDEVKLGAWSLIEAHGTGSALGFSKFQAGQPQKFELETGESKVARFNFEVPETVDNGVYICPDIWVGMGEKIPYFESLVHEYPLFCITKGLNGDYSVLSKQAAKAVIRSHNGMRKR